VLLEPGGGAAVVARRPERADEAAERAQAAAAGAAHEVAGHALHGAVDVAPVAAEGGFLLREVRQEGVEEAVAAAAQLDLVAGVGEALVGLRHPGPLDLAAGDQVHQPTRSHARPHLADVVHADVPGVRTAPERVREPPGPKVPLQHQHPLPPQPGHQGPHGQRTHPRADEDEIRIGVRHRLLFEVRHRLSIDV